MFIYKGRILTFLFLIFFMLSSAVCAKTITGRVMDGQSAVSGAKIEIILLAGGTYYTSGNYTAPPVTNFSGGSILQSSNGSYYVTTTGSNGYIKSPQTNTESGIFISESDTTPATKSLMVRAWSADGNKYGYSGSFPWGDAQQGNLTQNVGNISLTYAAAKPGTPTVILTHSGYDLDLNPLVTGQITIADSELITYKYQYHLDDITNSAAKIIGTTYQTDASSFSIPSLQLGHTYQLYAKAHNGFGWGDTEGKSGQITIKDSSGTPAPVSFTLTFNTGDENSQLSLNFFALPFAPDANGKWYAPGNTTNKEIKTAYDLVRAINEANGKVNIVSTFGKWDSAPSAQKDAGVLLPGNDPAPVKADLEKIVLKQGEGYQLYVTQPGSINIKNKP
jgi:hypothetical protein